MKGGQPTGVAKIKPVQECVIFRLKELIKEEIFRLGRKITATMADRRNADCPDFVSCNGARLHALHLLYGKIRRIPIESNFIPQDVRDAIRFLLDTPTSIAGPLEFDSTFPLLHSSSGEADEFNRQLRLFLVGQ